MKRALLGHSSLVGSLLKKQAAFGHLSAAHRS
jgi:hypothetical protein